MRISAILFYTSRSVEELAKVAGRKSSVRRVLECAQQDAIDSLQMQMMNSRHHFVWIVESLKKPLDGKQVSLEYTSLELRTQ